LKTLFLVLTVLVVSPAWAKKDDVDHLALAAALLRDGHADRASKVLAQVDPADETLAKDRYHTLRGLAAYELKAYEDAYAAFSAAVEAGAKDDALQVYRAQCAYELKRCEDVLKALDEVAQLEQAPLYLMRAECQWQTEAQSAALQTLVEGGERFPEKGRDFVRIRVKRLVEVGLFQTAVETADGLLTAEATLDDYLFLSEALLQSNQHAAARAILEKARLRWPDDERPTVQLAHAWLGTGHTRTAALMFERAADQNPRYAKDAAEIHRRRGAAYSALLQNARILDQQAKLRQRVGILLERERFAAVSALGPRLDRLGLLESDEELRYALAYAWFRQSEFKAAERELRRLKRSDLFERAAGLRKAMAECRQSPDRCP
jgi:hypothetical protein